MISPKVIKKLAQADGYFVGRSFREMSLKWEERKQIKLRTLLCNVGSGFKKYKWVHIF